MSSKTKTGLTESTPTKASPATPRVSKLSRLPSKSDSNASSPSPLQTSRLSIDRSPHSVNSKAAIDRRSPKVATPTEKTLIRTVKGSEVQAQLSLVQEDLRKANEHIALLEKEKCKALEELQQAQKVVEETNGKLEEALVAQKRAQEDSEVEKFRVVELEQTRIEAVSMKEEEWKKEIESIRSQHALDISALFSTTEELQKAKQDLIMVTDAKNQALSHADDATRIAEIHAEKAELLSAELARHKSLFDTKIQNETSETNKIMMKLREEIDSLNQELVKTKGFEGKMIEKDALVEKVSVELEAAKMAESYAHKLAEEWQKKLEELEMEIEQSGKLEKSASESLSAVMRQLEESNDLLHDSENEIASLKEKVGLLEMTIGRQKVDLEESERRINVVKGESASMEKQIQSLSSELDTVKEERTQALDNEKLAASSVQSLLEEKNKLINDIEIAKVEEEKSKKAMESLTSALHEVSGEARVAKERLLSIQVEHESNERQIEDMKVILKSTNEKYESMLDDAKQETDTYKLSVEESKNELLKLKTDWKDKEQSLVDSLKKSEEHNASLEKEIDRLVNLLKHTEEEACVMRDEETQLQQTLKEVKAELVSAKEALDKLKAENLQLRDSILDKETELQNVFQENEDVRMKECAAIRKVEELSKLLDEAMTKKKPEDNGELSDSEKDYAVLPKVVEFSEENGHAKEEGLKFGHILKHDEEVKASVSLEQSVIPSNGTTSRNHSTGLGSPNSNNNKEDDRSEHENDSVEVEYKMWESCQIEKKEYLPDRELEHDDGFEEDVNEKTEAGEAYGQINGFASENADDGSTSPSKQESQKKKKPLFRKFGSLLKKKGSNTPK